MLTTNSTASKHGTRNRYVVGCRCRKCKSANSAYQVAYQQRRADSGKCSYCAEPPVIKGACEEHRAGDLVRMHRRYDRLRSEGRCVGCKKKSAFARCRDCRWEPVSA